LGVAPVTTIHLMDREADDYEILELHIVLAGYRLRREVEVALRSSS